MKKVIIAALGVLSIGLFVTLSYYGFKYSRGVPVAATEEARPLLEVPFISWDIDFNKGIDSDFWDTRPSIKIDLHYQLMAIPWPKKSTPYVNVKAFHNRKDIYFYLQWPDNTEDRRKEVNEFPDSAAVMFPLGKNTQPSTLMMGFLGKANIWHWKANQDAEYWLNQKIEFPAYSDFNYPFEEEELFVVSKEKFKSAINDLVAIRVGTISLKPIQSIAGRGVYNNGSWRAVFRRSLAILDEAVDVQFPLGKKLCAFGIWNGSEGDRGGRKSISDWVEVGIK